MSRSENEIRRSRDIPRAERARLKNLHFENSKVAVDRAMHVSVN
jgi:hypothetical protein